MSKKRYFFRYKGDRYWVYANSDREAGSLIEKKKKEIDEAFCPTEMRLKEWAETCIGTYKTCSENEKKHLLKVFRLYILPVIGDKKLYDITTLDCQRTVNEYADKSKTLIDYVFNLLRFIMRRAYICELIKKDPSDMMMKPKGTRGRRRALTREEREAVIKVASRSRRHYAFLLMILCGCRPSEAFNCMGKDIEGHMLHIRGTKTKDSDRFVPIPDSLYALIKNTPKNEYIALSERGNKQGDNAARIWRGFKYYVNKEMGVETYRNRLLDDKIRDLTPYCLRHEYCTELARRGIDIRVAQRLMGHSSIKMTADVYTSLELAQIEEKAKELFAM